MPSPNNRLKLTGDTHLPDVGDDGTGDDNVLAFEPVENEEGASGGEAPAAPHESSRNAYMDKVRRQVRQRPVAALAGAFVLGLLLARI
jgi:hypothetical protein